MHKILYFVGVICILAMAQDVYAARGYPRGNMYYVHFFPKFTIRTVQSQGYQEFASFVEDASWKEEVPGGGGKGLVRKDFRKWFEEENLKRNGRDRNIFHLYGLFTKRQNQPETQIGYVQFGRLPGYSIKLQPHLFRFIREEKGIGIATFIPIFKDDCSDDEIVGALENIVKFVRALRTKGYTLPDQGPLPSYLVGIFSHSNPVVRLLKKAGFNYNFYDDARGARVLAYHPIKDEEPELPCPRISPSCRKVIESAID